MNDEQNIVVENELLRRGFTSIPNYIFGMPISSNAKLIYMALLSYAWNNRSCYPGLAKLCSDVSLSDKPVTKAIEELTQAALLEVKRRGQGKTNIYIIKDFTSTTPSSNNSDSRIGESPNQESEKLRFKNRKDSESKTGESPALKSENLRNPIEEKYTVEERQEETHPHKSKRADSGVGVNSKFTLKECRRYAAHLHATGQGITNPGGYATTIYRSGEVDPLIENFLQPLPPTPTPADSSKCPDCHGTGYWYPKGIERGVTKCKHNRLTNEGLTPEAITEQATLIADLLENGYTLEQAEAQFASDLHPNDWQKIQEIATSHLGSNRRANKAQI